MPPQSKKPDATLRLARGFYLHSYCICGGSTYLQIPIPFEFLQNP